MRKALLIGINEYKSARLNCCVNDVKSMKSVLEYHFDVSKNFHTKILLDEKATRSKIRENIKDLFSGEGEIALLYFSGHGCDDDSTDGIIISYDYEENDYGIKMSEILSEANKSKFSYKIIILDCCHSGYLGNSGIMGDTSYLNNGVVIMTASKKNEYAGEINGHGIFTNLVLEAINGGATDILGNITPGSIYSYIDQALGPWSQRPLFKANISSFISLKQCEPKITINELKDCLNLFLNDDSIYSLDPSFEKTNTLGSIHRTSEPFAKDANVELFSKLQKCNRNGLIIPYEASDMYFAAMESKGCKLTPLGKHYWKMMKEDII